MKVLEVKEPRGVVRLLQTLPLAGPVIRFLPMLGVMGLIFLLSDQPGDTLPLPAITGLDKVLHALAYAVLGLSFLHGIAPKVENLPIVSVVLVTMGGCLLYGLTDEWHQTMIPGRVCSLGDLVADMLGGGVAGLIWPLWLGLRAGG